MDLLTKLKEGLGISTDPMPDNVNVARAQEAMKPQPSRVVNNDAFEAHAIAESQKPHQALEQPALIGMAMGPAGRGFVRQFFSDETDLWTEGMLTENEGKTLKDLVKKVVTEGGAAGKDRLHYDDYDKEGLKSIKLNKGTGISTGTEDGNLMQEGFKKFLGNARVTTDGENVYVSDVYNFNDTHKGAYKAKTLSEKLKFVKDAFDDEDKGMFDILHVIGEVFGSSEERGEGTPVRIKVGSAEDLGLTPEQLKDYLTYQEYEESAQKMLKSKREGWEKANAEATESSSKAPEKPKASKPTAKPKEPAKSRTRAPAKKAPAKKAPAAKTYKIKSGDTLSAIAKRHGTTVAALAAKNGIKDVDDIRAGATLKL